MKTLNFNTRYALVTFSKSEIENYDFTVEQTDNDLDWLENEAQDPIYNEGRKGATIVEKVEDGIVDYYTREYLQEDSIERLGYKSSTMKAIIADSKMSLEDELTELEAMPENFINCVFETSYDEMTPNQQRISVEKVKDELEANAKTLTQAIEDAINEKDLADVFEIKNECSVMVDGREVFQVQPEEVAKEVLEDFKNFDGFEAASFDFNGETYYFVKQ